MTFTDNRDGQSYATIEINGKTWLAQNLAYRLAEGCLETENPDKNGLLYTWEAAKLACPEGWHLPSTAEWKALLHWAGGYFDWKEKEEKGNATDAFQAFANGKAQSFGLQLAGWRNLNGALYDQTLIGYFWTADEDNAEEAQSVDFNQENLSICINYNDFKINAYSLRLVKNG